MEQLAEARMSFPEGTPRAVRRQLLAKEAKLRASGDWPPWEAADLPDGNGGRGWGVEVRRVYRNWVFAVQARPLPDGAVHFAIGSLSGIRPTWHEMQRIKDELAGPEKTAIEIYPPQAEIVDGADMFHIWILPGPLPYSIHGTVK